MAQDKSVMGPINWNEPIQSIGPAGDFTPLEPSATPSRATRAGFENVVGEKLRAGFANVAQGLLLPFRIPTFETEPYATKLSKSIPNLFGVTEAGRPEDIVQRTVGGGVEALPTVLFPGPKGASLFTRSPRAGGEALTTAFGAGAGFELGRTAGEGTFLETPLAIGGALSGGTASSILYNAFTAAPKIGKEFLTSLRTKVEDAVGNESYNKIINAVNADQINRIMIEDPTIPAKLSRIAEIQQLIPGFSPNLYQATGATTVGIRAQAALQRQVDKIPEVVSQTERSMDAVRSKVAELFPITESSFVFAGRQADKTKTALASLVKTADDNIEQLSSTFVKSGRQELGDRIRQAYEGRRQAVSRLFKEQYDALDSEADSLGTRLGQDQVGQIYNTVLQNRQVFEQSPELFNLVQSAFKPREATRGATILGPTGEAITAPTTTLEFDPVKFNDIRSLSRRVNSDFYSAQQATAANVPGAGQRLFALGQLKTQIDNAIETLPSDVKDKYKALNAAYDDQYREVFRKGLGGLVGAKTRMGERLKDEDIIGQLTKPSNVDDFYRIFGQNAETEQFLTNGMITKFLSQDNAITSTGVLNQDALRTFVRRNEEVIGKVPSLQNFLANAEANMDSFIAQKNAAIEGTQALQRSALAAIARKQNIDEVLTTNQSGAFSDLTKMSQLIAASKADPTGRALKGLQGLMVDKALDSADPVQFLDKNRKAFERAFGKDFATVEKLTEAGQILGRSFPVSPPTRVLEGDVIERAIGTSGPGIGSLLRDRLSSFGYKASILFSRFTQQKGIEAKDNAFLEVFKNPDLAKEAAKHIQLINSQAASDKVKEAAKTGLYGLLVRAGVNMYRAGAVTGAAEMGQQREEEAQQQELNTPVEIPQGIQLGQ
jgi:hypothetical protein